MNILGSKARELIENRVAASLDTLNANMDKLINLYTVDLTHRGIIRPDVEEEGEVLDTNEDEVANTLEELARRRGSRFPGAYIGGEPEVGSAAAPEHELPKDQESIFGGGWGFNVGPEGAEKDWAGPPSNRGLGEGTPGDVPGQSSGEKQEG